MKDNGTTFHEELRTARSSTGLTLQNAAERACVPEDVYKNWEDGLEVPDDITQILVLSKINNPPTAEAKIGDIVFITTEHITADKCQVLESSPEFPYHVLVKSLLTGETYDAYPAWHCYSTEEDAIRASQKYANGHRDIIY